MFKDKVNIQVLKVDRGLITLFKPFFPATRFMSRHMRRHFSPVKDPRTVHALRTRFDYHMGQSVVTMRLVNLRSVNCYTDQNFKENAHFGALNLFMLST